MAALCARVITDLSKVYFNSISVKRRKEMISAIWVLADNLARTVWCSVDLDSLTVCIVVNRNQLFCVRALELLYL